MMTIANGFDTDSRSDMRGESSATASPLLQVRGLNIYFRSDAGEVQAVRDLSYDIMPGEALGMVGESGSGKSVSALALLRLLQVPPARIEGSIQLDGTDLLALTEREMQRVRGREIAMIFQEPMTALDPLYPVGKQIMDTIRAHQDVTRKQAKAEAIEALDHVGIPLPAQRFSEYPHQLSGGMRQRVMIAMAISCQPKLLIADEPTTAVDVTIQAQILELLHRLSQEHGMAMLLITHDLGVVAEACSRVITMYAGEAVEAGPVDDLLETPAHPYTSALLGAIPRVETRKQTLHIIPGRVPLLGQMPDGCRFEQRCEHASTGCDAYQELRRRDDGRLVRCHRSEELDLPGAV